MEELSENHILVSTLFSKRNRILLTPSVLCASTRVRAGHSREYCSSPMSGSVTQGHQGEWTD